MKGIYIHTIIYCLCLGAGIPAATAKEAGRSEIASQFTTPPDSAKPWVYWMWQDGNITREGITADLEAMRRVGIGGALIMEIAQDVPKGPVQFGSPEWRELFRHAVAEAGRLGLEINMNNDAGWCGSGGPWITPDRAMQKVVWTETYVEGPRRFTGILPQPQAVESYYRDIAVLAFPTPANDADPKRRVRIDRIEGKTGQVREAVAASAHYAALPAEAVINRNHILELTARLDPQGHLAWDVPAGQWTLLRIGHTPTGAVNSPAPANGRGLECDKLSREAIDEHFAGLIGKLIADVGPAASKTLTHVHIDSWEVHSQNWTPRFRDEFRERRGYDLLTLLPVMTGRVVDGLEVSERFLWDMRKTIAELIDENYAGRLLELAHRHGLKLSIEAYGDGPFDALSYAGRADSPMGEFWIGPYGGMNTVRPMASAAHTYGKNIVGAEAFTAVPALSSWTNHPFSLKALGDVALSNGVNRFVIHGYAHQPWPDRRPGMTIGPFGVHYERTETWWEQSRPWHEYLARCSYLLRQGLFVADLCYLQPEGVPGKMYGLTHATPSPFDFDGCTPEVVLTRMKVRDGRLMLPDGMNYRLLVLPPCETMTLELLEKIEELVRSGATVVGPRPARSPSLSGHPRCDARVRELAAALWGGCDGRSIAEHRYGKGKVVWGKTPEAVLAEMGVPPDFCSSAGAPPDYLSTETAGVRSIHRDVDGTEVYFVANGSPQALDVQCTFRVKGKRPEFWRPDTGRIEQVEVYEETDDGTRLPISFNPCGSLFVVFRPDAASLSNRPIAPSRNAGAPVGAAVVLPRRSSENIAIDGPWKLSFPRGCGAPKSIALDKLISWPNHADAEVKYFSGTATYAKKLHVSADLIDKSRRVYLDLGRVQVIAEVKLNDRELGILWKPPFRVDVSEALKDGENALEVRVTNLWVNRLIGDEQLPEDCKWGPLNRWGGQPLAQWPQWLLEGRPSPAGRRAFTTWRHWTKDSPLLESGLLGPIRLVTAERSSIGFIPDCAARHTK